MIYGPRHFHEDGSESRRAMRRRADDPPPAPVKAAERLPYDPNRYVGPLRRILDAVSAVTGIPYVELISHRRQRAAARARFVFYVVARNTTPATLPQIGRSCGGRDHSTIKHGIDYIARHQREYQATIDAVMELLHLEPHAKW